MTTIKIEITTCRQCPFFKEGPMQSTDGWDRGHDWICTKMEGERKIAGFVEWHEIDKIPVPDWCPVKVEPSKS